MKAIMTREGARVCGVPEIEGRKAEIENWDGKKGDVLIDGKIYARDMHKDDTDDGDLKSRWVFV